MPTNPPIEPVTASPPPLDRRAVLRQQWTDLAYFHWRYDPDLIQSTLPPGVSVDVFDGSAWVGLIPFVMRRVRIGPTPPVPWLGTFVEVNVRTYVVDERGRRAVWFWSLDVPRTAIVAVARTLFSLPYCWSRASHELVDAEVPRHRYEVRRRWPAPRGAEATIEYGIGEEIVGDDLAHFLSARWALVTTRRGRPVYGRVHHPAWPLHEVVDPAIDEELVAAAGLPEPVGAMHAMCSPGVPVSVGWFEPVRRPGGRFDDQLTSRSRPAQ